MADHKNVTDKSPIKGISTDQDLSTGHGGSKFQQSSMMENNLAGASKMLENSLLENNSHEFLNSNQ